MRLTPLSTPAYTSPRLANHQASSPSAHASKPDAFTPTTSIQRQGAQVEVTTENIHSLITTLTERIALADSDALPYLRHWQSSLKSLLQLQKKLNGKTVPTGIFIDVLHGPQKASSTHEGMSLEQALELQKKKSPIPNGMSDQDVFQLYQLRQKQLGIEYPVHPLSRER